MLHGIWNGTIERGPACSKSKRGHHEPRVAKHSLRLVQTLAFDLANEAVRVDVHTVESEGSGVAEANAVLVLRFVMGETLRTFFNDEPTGTAGRVREDRVSVGDTSVADPLLVAGNLDRKSVV